jgi:hypothetical protein
MYPFIDKTSPKSVWLAESVVSASGAGAFDAPYVLSTISTEKWTDNFHGVRASNWRHKIAKGQLTSPAATGNRSTVDVQDGFLEVKGWVNSTHSNANMRKNGIAGAIYRPSSIPSALSYAPGPANRDAAASILAKYAATISRFQAQVAGGESRQALQMMKSRGQKILASIPGLPARFKPPRRHFRDGREALKHAADTYLEWTYGMVPLFNDIKAGYKVLQEYRPPFRYIKGGIATNPITNEIVSENRTAGSGVLRYNTSLREVETYSIFYSCVARLYGGNVPGGSSLIDDAGFTVDSFIPSLYNLLPWSFLLDYFSNLNQVITGFSYYDSFPNTYCETTINEHKLIYWAGNARPQSSTFDSAGTISQASTITVTSRNFSRVTHNGGLPFPRLHFRMPGIRQGLNIAALAVSRRFKML